MTPPMISSLVATMSHSRIQTGKLLVAQISLKPVIKPTDMVSKGGGSYITGFVLNITIFVLNLTGLVLNMTEFVQGITEFALNMTGCVSNMSGSVLIMTGSVLYMPGFVLNMTDLSLI